LPELPDVETFRRYLTATALHQKVGNVRVTNTKVLKGVGAKRLSAELSGHSFESAVRHGKNILVETDGGPLLRLHFGMTGYLDYHKADGETSEHARVIFPFDSGYNLDYVCQRLFGMVSIEKDHETFADREDLGPDAYELSRGEFKELLRGRRGAIKTALMNQSVMSGIGNVYADEILFQAGLLPEAKVAELSDEDLDHLYKVMNRVMTKTIEKKAQPSDFPRSYLTPRREPGADCPGKCTGKIEKKYVSQRPTYYCPRCQGTLPVA